MFPLLQLGPLAIQLPGLFLLAGVWVATWLIDRVAPRHNVSATKLNNMVFLGLIAGILGARIWYAVRYLDVYLQEPLSLFALNPSTIAPLEGILTAVIAAVIYGQRKSMPLWATLDALAIPFNSMAVAIGLANLSSGDAFGAVSDLPWAIELWGARRHPTQMYEIVLGALILLALWRLRKTRIPSGTTFFLWLSMASAARLFLEAFRGDSVIVLDVYRLGQIVSLLILILALIGLRLRYVQGSS
ncbi:MAG: prolipoprotein diacylglyceryl transferase [Anaerolineales bacterium]|nr:prolipoprotein diacylglyceryl transferase [Anaerolineales bacterium]